MNEHQIFQNILNSINHECKSKWKTSFKALVLFGSTVKSLKRETDIDLFIVVDQKSKFTRHETIKIMEDFENHVSLELNQASKLGFHWVLSIKIKNKEDALHFNPLYLDWVDTSKILFEDSEKIITDINSKTNKLIQEKKIVKTQKGLLWYWDLAPGMNYDEERTLGW